MPSRLGGLICLYTRLAGRESKDGGRRLIEEERRDTENTSWKTSPSRAQVRPRSVIGFGKKIEKRPMVSGAYLGGKRRARERGKTSRIPT